MGACDISFTLDGNKSRSDVTAAFEAKKLNDQSYNGHQEGYSGDFQTVDDVKFHDRIFDTEKEAFEYCLNNAKKWEYVVAVKYKNIQEIKPDTKHTKLKIKLTAMENQLNAMEKQFTEQLTAKLKSVEFLTHKDCKSRVATKFIFNHYRLACPVCNGSLLSASDQNKRAKLKAKIEELKKQIEEHTKQLTAKAAEKVKDTTWLVAGWGAC